MHTNSWWTRRQTLGGGLSLAGALALGGCKDDPAASKKAGTGDGSGNVALDAAAVTASLGAALGDSPWADKAAAFAGRLQGMLDTLRADGHDATADFLATGANDMLAPVADVTTAAIAMGTDATALQEAKGEAFKAILSARDSMMAGLPALREELREANGGDAVEPVTDPAVFAEVIALEEEARVAMHAVGADGNGPANAVLRGFQQFRAQIAGERSVDDVVGRMDDSLSGLRATAAADVLHQAAENPAPPPDDAEDFLENVCFAMGFIPVGPGGFGESGDEIAGLILAQFGIIVGEAGDDTCSAFADGMTVVLALIDMALVFVEVAAIGRIGAVLPGGAGILFLLFMLLAVWMAIKLMCDAIALATVLNECVGGSR
jgi:hypothetical protein